MRQPLATAPHRPVTPPPGRSVDTARPGRTMRRMPGPMSRLVDLSHPIEAGMVYRACRRRRSTRFSNAPRAPLYGLASPSRSTSSPCAEHRHLPDSPFHRYADGMDLAALPSSGSSTRRGAVDVTAAAVRDRRCRARAPCARRTCRLVHTGLTASGALRRTCARTRSHPGCRRAARGAGAALVGIDCSTSTTRRTRPSAHSGLLAAGILTGAHNLAAVGGCARFSDPAPVGDWHVLGPRHSGDPRLTARSGRRLCPEAGRPARHAGRDGSVGDAPATTRACRS
jgi:hypothetical protein